MPNYRRRYGPPLWLCAVYGALIGHAVSAPIFAVAYLIHLIWSR